ncbi:MAG: nucleoside 2-deoxyribosyltransferase [Lentisphaeria bacterium]|nr:nucleoside 2-deoxyribosyltransferase [Lentisphaeria bacterium]
MEKEALKIYFAGDLFDAKDLIGNILLAEAIERQSGGRYKVMLPQNGECEVTERTSQSIRDADFKLLFDCDVIVANFDGTDLDSGTVVEFCFARMVDMPAVLLRTDFRNSGDHSLPDGDPWNLMCSHYPRTKVLHINAMMRYHDCLKESSGTCELIERFCAGIAADVVQALDDVVSQKSWLKKEQVFTQYQMAVKSVGGTLETVFSDDKLKKITDKKIKSGLFG